MPRIPNRMTQPSDTEAVAAPKWLQSFANSISQALRADEDLAPIGCHFHREQDGEQSQWEVTLFVSATEIYVGACDGQRGASRFFLDVQEVIRAFSSVESVYWQAQRMSEDDDLGPHVGIEGHVDGRSIWLRVTADPPAQFEQQTGRVVDRLANAVCDRW